MRAVPHNDYFRSLWLLHFYGHEGYRETLRCALYGLILLVRDSSRNLGDTHPISQQIKLTLRKVVEEQLEWTLDDLGFGPYVILQLRDGLLSPALITRMHTDVLRMENKPRVSKGGVEFLR